MNNPKYDENKTQKIISDIAYIRDKSYEFIEKYTDAEYFSKTVNELIENINNIKIAVLDHLDIEHGLYKICHNIEATLMRLKSGDYKEKQRGSKIQFELVPFIEEAYLYAKFYLWAVTSEENLQQYYKEMPELCSNRYVNEAEKTGKYKYDLAISVTGYNKLEYTKMCVETLLRSIPEGLNYELILINHGSSDGTKEYFESIAPTKQIDFDLNMGGFESIYRTLESKYHIYISNDIILGTNSIKNMLACMESDPMIARSVPSTPNVSNLQTIATEYDSFDDFADFTAKNNVSDPFRWEQRTKLVDPISIVRTSAVWGKDGVLPNGYMNVASVIAFPDDLVSMLLRRKGYKMMLMKDSYCHHFGSITIRDDVNQSKNADIYDKGRITFKETFGLDPWGPGCCYTPAFINKMVGDETEHVDILGINCGMGSNCLKIKEQLKEYCHNTDVSLSNIIDASQKIYTPDLLGMDDDLKIISTIKEFKDHMNTHKFKYIVWDQPFLTDYKFGTLIDTCVSSIEPNGKLLLNAGVQNINTIEATCKSIQMIGDGWVSINL